MLTTVANRAIEEGKAVTVQQDVIGLEILNASARAGRLRGPGLPR